MKKSQIEKLHLTAKGLNKETQKLTNRLFRLTSESATNKESLITLAAYAGKIAYHFASLGTDIRNIHEENQKNGINSNS